MELAAGIKRQVLVRHTMYFIMNFILQARRLQAVKELVRVLRTGGEALIYVWALEQEHSKVKSNYLKETRIQRKETLKTQEEDTLLGRKSLIEDGLLGPFPAGNNKEDEDQLSNGVTSVTIDPSQRGNSSKKLTNHNQEVKSAINSDLPGALQREVTSDRRDTSQEQRPSLTHVNLSQEVMAEAHSPSLTVHVNRTHFEAQDLLVPWHSKPQERKAAAEGASSEPHEGCHADKVVHRFYHVFREGELEDLCRSIPGVKVVDRYYDKGNWCVILSKHSEE